MDLCAMNAEALAQISFDCECGHHHASNIKKIIVESGALSQVGSIISSLGAKQLFLVADNHTWEICGRQVEADLLSKGFALHTLVYQSSHPLVPNEQALGTFISEIQESDDLIVTIGSGTLNDLSRMISCKTKIPYIIVATAPSMDGFASTVSPLILRETKITLPAVAPSAIIADTRILKDAPLEMVQAGYGDILGKYTALADWRLSAQMTGEYYCEKIANLMQSAVEKCVSLRHLLQQHSEEATGSLMNALIISGIAMALVGNSRPASGAEHHFSHYWEIDALAHGRPHPLHGNSVGVGALLSASLYAYAQEDIPETCMPPKPEIILELLHSAGSTSNPKNLGIDRELFIQSVNHAMEVRDRYTILRFCSERNTLSDFAERLAQKFYD